MTHFRRAGIFLLLVVSILLVTAIEPTKKDSSLISFTTTSGYTGNITLTIPQRVFAGDRNTIKAVIQFDDLLPLQPPAALEGRLEAGFEEISPSGRIRVNLKPESSVEMAWTLRTGRQAIYPGNLWLWLVTDSNKDLLLVREFDLDSQFYLGMRVMLVRIVYVLLLVISVMLLVYSSLKKGD
jgi:hypothetical protein